ncbi:helix-turn-helix domain-containing protein [Micromonospora sp. NPDC052213]|uniref:helix-turn-helix domain-containing protein n=1 Tax=Micromonospora sp. NPDC052213 TaxID=3155812 RepID=UPI003438D620
MSVAVKSALLATRDLGKNERAVAIAIAAHANHDGNAWPSVATIAEYAGCSERTVQRALAKLVQLGRLVVTKVAGIATRVYRLVLGQGVSSAPQGVTNQPAGVTDQGTGGDSQGDTRSVEDQGKLKNRAGARDWRRFLPKNKNTTTPRPGGYPYPERRGAALPPVAGTDQCPRHRGSLAHNCGPCRSEALAGGR